MSSIVQASVIAALLMYMCQSDHAVQIQCAWVQMQVSIAMSIGDLVVLAPLWEEVGSACTASISVHH